MTRVKDARELDEQLSELVDWERFGVHLGMSKSEVDIIDRDKPDIANKKLTLFDKCLKANPSLTWEDVIEALEKIKENTLANKVKLAKLSCTKVSERENSVDHPAIVPVRVCGNIAKELDVLNKSFVTITENLKKEIEIAFRNGSMTMKQIVSRTTEEQAYIFPDDFWHVDNVYDFFKAIRPFYSFLDCYLIVCLASLFKSSTVVVEANEYEKKVEVFKDSTDVNDLFGALEVYFPQSLDEGTSVRITIVVQRSWGTQKLWLVEELIRVLIGLEKKECHQWFRVRPGSVILDFLLPQRLIMFAIVQCVNKLEFLQLMGVIAIRVGTILVMRKTEDTKFSFQNSFIEACKLGKIEFVELLLRFSQVNVNKPSENMFLQHTEIELSHSQSPSMIGLLLKLHFEYSLAAEKVVKDIIDNEMIELSSLMSFIHENRPSLASFFSSVSNKTEFFSVAQYFFNFLSLSLLVAIERVTCEIFSDIGFQMGNFAERIESIKKVASVSCFERTDLTNVIKSLMPQLPGIISVTLVLSNEWLACSLLVFEKLIRNIFSVFKHPEELHSLTVTANSKKMIGEFYLPECFQEQLIESSKQKTELMKALGIGSLMVENKSVLDNNCDDFTFEKAFSEAKENNNVDILKFLSEVQEDLLSIGEQKYTDENNNLTYECVPDSTALMISSAQGNLKIVKFLLDNGADPNIGTKAKATALMYAIYSGDYNVAQLLLKHNAHITDTSGLSMLHVTCHLGNAKILKLLLQQKPDVNVLDSVGATPLFISCKKFHVSLVPLLLNAHADPNIRNNNGTTPLSTAAYANCLPIVQCLLKAQADPNIIDKFGMTAIVFAIINSNFKMFKCLIDANADPCIEAVFGFSGLHYACGLGRIKMLKRILKYTKPNFQLSNGMTPLYAGCVEGQIKVVKLLIKANADPNIPCENMTPLCAACIFGNLKLVKILLNSKANPNYHDDELYPVLCGAIQSNCLEIVDILLKANANPDARVGNNKSTPLHIACLRRNLDITKSLLRAKANPNVQDISGDTPLATAITADKISLPLSWHNHAAPRNINVYEIVDALLEAGADPNIPNNENSTPLHKAAETGMADIVTRLLKGKAYLNIQTTEGTTPLHEATHYGHLGAIKVLLHNHADPNITDYTNEMAPLHIACTDSNPDGSLEIVKVFLSNSKTDPNILNAKHLTPLHYAAFNVHLKILQCLIASNANPNIQDQEGDTPLHFLSRHNASNEDDILACSEMVNMLLEANADPNVQCYKKMWAPLHFACYNGLLQIVVSLLKAKANPNVQNIDGSTPLLSVLQAGLQSSEDTTQQTVNESPNQYEIVNVLLEAEADSNITDKNNFTAPLIFAVLHKKVDIVDRLLMGKADPNFQSASDHMMTPLHYACISGCLEIVKILLKAKADPNVRDVNGATPLVALLFIGNGKSSDAIGYLKDPSNQYEIVDALLQAQADPNIADIHNCTSLHLAAGKEGKANIVARLLKEMADPNVQSSVVGSPLHFALSCGNLEVIKLLLRAKADPNAFSAVSDNARKAPLHIACSQENLEIVEVLLNESNVNPNILDTHKNTPLHYAARSSNPKIMQCLIASNANPNIQNESGYTPLHVCCNHKGPQTNVVEKVNILLQAHADPTVQTSDCSTSLHFACINGYLEIVTILLKAKAQPNIQNTDGSTPLVSMLFLKSCDDIEGLQEPPPNQYEIVDALLQAQADPNIENEDNFTPLYLAASDGKTDIVARLLKGKPNLNIQTKEGGTPLHEATNNGHLEVVELLLKEKADPNILDFKNRMAPLHITCCPNGSSEIAQLILSCPNTDPDILDGKLDTPLHYVVSSNAEPKLLQCLIASNANPNICNRDGYTPLHTACVLSCCSIPGIARKNTVIALEMTGILLKAKANPYMDSKLGNAFQIAIRGQNVQLQLILFLHSNS